MALLRPRFMQAVTGDPAFSYTAQDLRGLVDTLVASEGVATGLQVTQRAAGANMSVDVAAGRCVVLGDDAAGQGKYDLVSDAVANVVVPAAPASGTHTHRLVAQVRDKFHNASFTTYDWVLAMLADTGTGLPVEPASAITLATISVSAGQVSVVNANISSLLRPTAAGIGGRWAPYTPELRAGADAQFLANLGSTGVAAGRYTRIGDTVHVHGRIRVEGTGATFNGGAAGDRINITLPMPTAGQGLRHMGGVQIWDTTNVGDNLWHGIWEASALVNYAKLQMDTGRANGDVNDLTIGAAGIDIDVGTEYRWWGTYEAQGG